MSWKLSPGVVWNLFRVFGIFFSQLSGSNITLNPSGDFAILLVFAKTTLLLDVLDLFEIWVQAHAFFAICSVSIFVAAITTVPIASTVVDLIVAVFIPLQVFVACALAGTVSFGAQLAQKAKPRARWVTLFRLYIVVEGVRVGVEIASGWPIIFVCSFSVGVRQFCCYSCRVTVLKTCHRAIFAVCLITRGFRAHVCVFSFGQAPVCNACDVWVNQ